MKQYICLADTPWQSIPTRTQHLLSRFREAEILYFEPPGRGYRQPGRRVRPGLTVYTLPPGLEVEERHRHLFSLEQRRLARFIQDKMERHQFRYPVLWCTTPEAVHLVDALSHGGVVYDCSRVWDDMPIRWERELALAADVIFAVSPGLIKRLESCNDNVVLLPNGANYPMFVREGLECPEVLKQLKSPVFGWVGTIRRDLDLRPALYCARSLPRCSFVFLGRRERNPWLDSLTRLPNVYVLGACPVVDVPDYLALFDVCMNFVRLREEGSDLIPSRIYEYLSAGKPIVGMYAPEQVEAFPDVIYAAHSPEEFARMCLRALEERGDWARERRRAHGAQAAWSLRAEQATRILRINGLY